jgi:O-antigen ligase
VTSSARTDDGDAAPRRGDAALIAGAAAATVVFALLIARDPRTGIAVLAVTALAVAVYGGRHAIARHPVAAIVVGMALLVPAAALLGPTLSFPAFPQAFAFRLLLVAIVAVGGGLLLLRGIEGRFTGWDFALPLALWFGWLCLALVWAPDKAEGLRYLLVLGTMMALTAATALAGGSRRRLTVVGVTLVAACVLILGVTVLEYTTGYRVPISRLLGSTTQTYAVTSVFHNQNDLATYLALCWPFVLCAFFFTKRPLYLLVATGIALLSALAFVRTGSRSSLLAVGIASLAAIALLARPSARWTGRGAKIAGAALAVALLTGAGYLLFNESSNEMLRQFRLEGLTSDLTVNQGSGEIRTSLTDRGLSIAGGSLLLGAGPGQAEGMVRSSGDAPGIANLHNWWLETYVDGGLPAVALQLAFYLGLLVTLWPIARGDADPLLRYLASGVLLALLGFVIGALGPSSSMSFAPMWILYGLGIAVVVRARMQRPPAAEDVA